jgi:hypothetical protein
VIRRADLRVPLRDVRVEFERVILRPTRVACPRCRGTRVERLLSRFAQRSERGFVASVGNACGPCVATSCAGCPLKRGAT